MSAGSGRADVVRAIEATGVVAVIRLEDGALLRDVAHALAEGGVTALEVTMTVPRAVRSSRSWRHRRPSPRSPAPRRHVRNPRS